MHTIKEIQAWCEKTGHSYWEYVEQHEGPSIWDYLAEVWEVMQDAVRRGLEAEGILPGGLGIRRKASDYMIRAKGYGSSIKSRGGERVRWEDRDRSDLWFLRCNACGPLSLEGDA